MKYKFKEDNNFTEDMAFGEFIKKKRRLIGYSQMELADLLGVNQWTISQWERRVSSPSFDTAKYIIMRMGGEVLIVNKDKDRDSV